MKTCWDREKVGLVWDFYAASAVADKLYFSAASGPAALRFVNRHVPLDEYCTVLDFGCGPGYLIEHLLRDRPALVYGTERSQLARQLAGRRISAMKGKAGRLGRIMEAPTTIRSASIDVVLSFEVLEHCSDPDIYAAIAEIHRVLKPGGHVVVTVPNEEDLAIYQRKCPDCGAEFHPWQHVQSFTAARLEAFLSPAFRPILCRAVSFGEDPLARIRKAIWRALGLPLAKEPKLVFIGKKF